MAAVGAEHHSLIPVSWLTKAFVAGDLVCLMLQGCGGGIQSAVTIEPRLYKVGEKIVIAGLFSRLVIFGLFVSTVMLFHIRLSKTPTPQSYYDNISWRRHHTILYVASGFIMMRSLFRVVEYIQGNEGYLVSHETLLYAFDTVLMAAVMVLFIGYIADHERKEYSKDMSEGSSC